MDEDAFWRAVESAGDRRFRALEARLARLPVGDIVRFHTMMVEKCDRLLTCELWEAAQIITGAEVSEDNFYCFRPWVVALGREMFEWVLDDPDLLAEHPQVRRLAGMRGERWSDEDYPHAEELLGVGEAAFEVVLAKLHPRYAALVEFPDAFERRPRGIPDARWPAGFGEAGRLERLYPDLTELFAGGGKGQEV
ncbi:DUF4240 domain-containing protein [Dactylosporangium sp. NPDC049742]|uniref:DUF4240 domain-containing protein n=1 Tax=Dactylosporangium sp. NPDC049742 TaxID=3154737 RepID=UPI003446A7FB